MTKGQRKKQKRMRKKLEAATISVFSQKRLTIVKVCIMRSIKN